MEKTFAEKLHEWTLYEDAHPSNLRSLIREAASEIESLTAANQRLRAALEDAINDCEFDYLRTRWRLVLNENGDK